MENKTFLQVVGEGEEAGFRPVSEADISEAALERFIDFLANRQGKPADPQENRKT